MFKLLIYILSICVIFILYFKFIYIDTTEIVSYKDLVNTRFINLMSATGAIIVISIISNLVNKTNVRTE